MRTVFGMISLGASVFVAGCVSNVTPSDTGPHFVKTRSIEGVSVALTSDGCTASVLFDSAAVSGGTPPQLVWGAEFGLKVDLNVNNGMVDRNLLKNGIHVSGTASGYYSGTGKAIAEIEGGAMELRIFDYAANQKGNWTSNIKFPGPFKPDASFGLFLKLRGDEERSLDEGGTVITKMPPADAMLTVDSVDLVIAECGKPAV